MMFSPETDSALLLSLVKSQSTDRDPEWEGQEKLPEPKTRDSEPGSGGEGRGEGGKGGKGEGVSLKEQCFLCLQVREVPTCPGSHILF